MKSYEKYKDSGVQWIGEIPSHWDCVKPQHLFSPVQREPEDGDEIVTCFRDGVVTLRKNRREDGFTTSLKEIGYQRVMVGDLVVHEMDGFEGSIGISDSTGKSTPVYTIIQPSPNNYNPYWMYLLREMANTRFIQCLSKSIRERTTEFRWLMWKGQLFPLPPLTEQHQIVSFLDEKTSLIDDLINKKEQKIGLLKEYRTSLINRVITKGLNPDCPMKDSGVEWIGEIPSHWDVKRLKYVSDIEYGISPPDTTYNDEGIGSVLINGPVEYSETDFGYTRSIKWTTEPKKFTQKGSLLFCLRGSTTGRMNITHEDVSIGRGVCSINSHQNQWYMIYSMFCVRDWISGQLSGSTFPSVVKEDVDNFVIPSPPVSEQEQIVSFLDDKTGEIDRTIQSEKKKIELLKEYRQSLISSVITGKIKVVN